jgi:hypothetical protein
VTVSYTVKPQNLEKLNEVALAVSTPTNSHYQEFLSMEEVNALTAPLASDLAAVTDFASSVGSVSVNAEQGIVTGTYTVAEAESLFKTTFHKMTHMDSNQMVVRAIDYSLPDAVAAATSAVFGMHGLPLAVKTAQQPAPKQHPPVTPAVINTLYKIGDVKASGSAKARTAVAEFQGQQMSQKDLVTFFSTYVPKAPASDAVVNKFVGAGADKNGEGIEAQLDIQYIMGVAPGVKTDFYEQMNSDFCADLKNWTTILLADTNAPLVNSVSYGWQGNLTQIGCTPAEVAEVDLGYQKLAAAGISIIFASGDSGSGFAPPMPPRPPPCSQTKPGEPDMKYTGVILRTLDIGVPPNNKKDAAIECCEIAGEIGGQLGGYAGFALAPVGNCTDPHKECMAKCTVLKTITSKVASPGWVSGKAGKIPPAPPPKAAMLWPSWPASSPWVTSVGATRFNDDKVGNPEAAVNQEDHFGAGGGFSPWKALPQAAWQKTVVDAYTAIAANLPDPKMAQYDITGRATPDVAALGTAFQVINGGKPLPGGVGGTSASAPTFAGIIGLINDQLLAAGKKQLGFLNPFIYGNPQAFTDVTIGSNKIGRGGAPLPYGWNCTKGWDPVTGMGTPLYPELLKAAMSGGGPPPGPTPPPGPPPHKKVCTDEQYCCPDAKHCLKPTKKSCEKDATSCTGKEICCPLTKICVEAGPVCIPPPVCKSTEYCCPDAKHCLTPVKPGHFCTGPGTQGSCAADQVCCPLTHECVTVGAACVAP